MTADPEAFLDFDEIEAFIALADELHFGQTARRLHLSQSRVSKLVAALEQRVGGVLFVRTTRRVQLSPLGARLREDLGLPYARMQDAIGRARETARHPAGLLRLGFMVTTEGVQLNRLVAAFDAQRSDCLLTLHEVSTFDPFAALRRGEVDVVLYWLVIDEPDLTAGPVIDRQARVLAVAASDPLAGRDELGIEEVGGRKVAILPPTFPRSLADAFIPPRIPAERPLVPSLPCASMSEVWTGVARGQIVHPTVTSRSSQLGRDDVKLIPLRGLPPMPLGLIWRSADENARVRALVEVSAKLGPSAKRPKAANSSRSGKKR